MPFYASDDCIHNNTSSGTTNHAVDYFGATLTDSQYLQAWKHSTSRNPQTVSTFRHTYPSTCPKRLRNVIWRLWYKTSNNGGELDPTEINWYKENDVINLFGPVFVHKEMETEFEMATLDRCASAVSFESISSYESDSMMDRHSRSSSFESSSPSDASFFGFKRSIATPRLALKRHAGVWTNSNGYSQEKRLTFNHVVSKREIINKQFYDYSYLDYELLV